MKTSYDDVIPTADHFFYRWDQRTSIPAEEMCEPQRGLHLKIKLIESHSIRVSWSAYELFSRPYIYIYIL